MTIRWAYLKRVLAGAIFGLYIAHLLYFLNPQVEITPLRLAIVTIIYGAICGLLFGTVLWLLRVVERNADLRRSRAIFIAGVVLIAISSFFLYQRRDSYRTEKQSVVVADVGTVAGQRPVIVVAIRNLPYDWILTLTGEGSLPFFDHARTRGYFTRLEPF